VAWKTHGLEGTPLHRFSGGGVYFFRLESAGSSVGIFQTIVIIPLS